MDGAQNKKMYDQLTPPLYNLAAIKVKTALIYGSQDNARDVLWLRDEVASGLYSVVYAKPHNLDHLGFIMSREMEWFDSVPELINNYESNSNFVNSLKIPSINRINGKFANETETEGTSG